MKNTKFKDCSNCSPRKTLSWPALTLICASLLTLSADAALKTWIGTGGTGNWSTSLNWSPSGAPAAGDDLSFPAGASGLINTNNLTRNFSSITFSGAGGGYVLRGNPTSLTNGITAAHSTGLNVVEFIITNGASQTITATTGGTLTLSNDVVFSSFDLTVNNTANVTLAGVLNGGGSLIKNGAGTLLLNGLQSNTYLGTTTVNAGVIQLAKTGGSKLAIPGNLIIGNGSSSATVQNIFGFEIVDTANLTITNNGTWDLNGQSETIGTNLNMSAGSTVSVGVGAMTLTAPSTITAGGGTCNINGTGSVQLGAGPCGINVSSGTLNVNPSMQGASAITKTGQGYLEFLGANTYTGLTTVSAGWLWAKNSLALGGTAGGTVVSNGATLVVQGGLSISNESLTLNGPGENSWSALDCENNETNLWAGPIITTADSTFGNYGGGTLRISGPISGPGGVNENGGSGGTLILEGNTANTYAGPTTVSSATLVLNKSSGAAVPGNLVINNGKTARLANDAQLGVAADVQVDGLFDFQTFQSFINTLHGSGTVSFGSGGWMNIGLAGGTSEFDGNFTGTGYAPGYTIGKDGGGTFTIGGNSTFTAGIVHLFNGKLVVNGSMLQNPIAVDSSGTLGGSGTVGSLTANGSIAPGNSPGILSCSNVTFSASGKLIVELNGPTVGSGYDQLNPLILIGSNILNGATLQVIPGFITPVAVGQQFTILNNNGPNLLLGTFAGLAEGAGISVGGYKFKISYIGGDGNDAVLTLTNIPAATVGFAVSAGNGSHSIDPNGCNNLDLVITNISGVAMNSVSATLSTTTPGVLITGPYSSYVNIPGSGKGTNLAPFQISTLPSFVCGTDINLQLRVDSSLGSFIMSFVLPTAETAGVVRFDNNIVTNCPDFGTIESTNNVPVWAGGAIRKVAVSLWLVAPIDSDMSLSLIAPNGTTVPLVGAFGAGANFGSGSADANRTTFDDSAATAITAGAPPFVGTFRPQGALTNFIGTTANGPWRLHIVDSAGSGSPDTLRAWSLFLSGTICATGSGACDYCLTSITGIITNTDLIQTDRISRNLAAASCGAPKSWPGSIDSSARHYDIYAFTNTMVSDACVTVLLTSPGDLQAGVYLNAFDPSNIVTNYVADSGDSTFDTLNRPQSCSASIPPGAKFFVTVNEVTPGAGTNYVLQLSGLPCPPPPLSIQPLPANKANLNWPSWAGGYKLEATPSLVPTNWAYVTNEPIVTSLKYNVTNSSSSPTNRFYRLHKP